MASKGIVCTIFVAILAAANVFSYGTNCSALYEHKSWHFSADKFDFELNIINTVWDNGPILFDGYITQENGLNAAVNGRCFPEESWTDSVSFKRVWSDDNGNKHLQLFVGFIDQRDGAYAMSGWYCDEEDIVDRFCRDMSFKWSASEI